MTAGPGGNAVPPDPSRQLPAPADTAESIRALVARAQAGDETARPALRRLIDHPRTAAVIGGLADRVRDALLRSFLGQNLLLREVTAREMDRLRAELLGPDPTPVERLLAERVAVGWLLVQDADLHLAGAGSEADQRRADHAYRRFLAALRELTLVRRLARPALQVNIAERQVNVTG
jgi:hypothetical protein